MGYKVKEIRVAKKMTQKELAEKSGVSRGTISALENGEAKVALSKTLVAIACALDVTVDQIFFDETA